MNICLQLQKEASLTVTSLMIMIASYADLNKSWYQNNSRDQVGLQERRKTRTKKVRCC